jgi:hypothetical protein
MRLFEYINMKNIKDLIMSGGNVGNIEIDNRNILKETVRDNIYHVFRGLYIMKFRTTKEQYDILKNLNHGDYAPEFLRKSGNDFSSASKSLSIANQYAKEGHINIILESKVSKENVLVDTENLYDVLNKHGSLNIFDRDDYIYFKKEKEVILIEPIKFMIYSIKVNKT